MQSGSHVLDYQVLSKRKFTGWCRSREENKMDTNPVANVTNPIGFSLCALCFSFVIEPIVLVVYLCVSAVGCCIIRVTVRSWSPSIYASLVSNTLLQRVVNGQVQGSVMTDLLW